MGPLSLYNDSGMAILVVGGSHRGVGKTALVCGLIAALPEHRWTAVKITSDDHGQFAPVWEDTEPGQGTDTARYPGRLCRSAAGPSVWRVLCRGSR